ncbi:MAG: hypothetical protein J6R68_04740 [Clostridia bacterium]|nr:hypothetical protein [Clostridia bacterium]MBO7288714.1 hypothetical protein [Clostridia bacterium]
MPDNEKKNALLSLFKGVFKNKKEENADIVTQAETVISDYISRRRNEIINKYCTKNRALPVILMIAGGAVLLYGLWFILA